MKRCKYYIRLAKNNVARFSDADTALRFGREESRDGCGPVEVIAPDGLIGQFRDGKATPEFSHLDR